MPIIDDVTFAYVQLQTAVTAFNKVDKEFKVSCILSKAQAKALGKEFPKQKATEVDTEEFEAKYKIAPPFPDADTQYVLTLKKAHIKDGKEMPEKYRPRVLEATEDGNVDVTFSKLIANGSTGKVSYRVKETDSYGDFIDLQAILVEGLIEYEGGGVPGSEFGAFKPAQAPASQKPSQQQEEEDEEDDEPKKPVKAPAKPTKPVKPSKPAQTNFDDMDDDIPF